MHFNSLYVPRSRNQRTHYIWRIVHYYSCFQIMFWHFCNIFFLSMQQTLTINKTTNLIKQTHEIHATIKLLITSAFLCNSKMPTVRNARSLATSRELPSGLQIWGKRPLNALFSVATMNADTDSASVESVKVIQERVAHGTLYVRLTCPTMDNRHNKPGQVPEF